MDYANPQYLVDAKWLAEHLHDENLRVVEVTGIHNSDFENIAKELCYDKQHIPGAVFLDVASIRGPFTPPDAEFPLTWTGPEQFASIMGKLGIGNDSHVVIYASTVGQRLYSCAMWCTRAWWLMHHFGVKCSILNGALEAWIAAGNPVTTVPGHYAETTFSIDENWKRGLVYKEDVLAALESKGSCSVVNALPAEMYLGQSDVVYGGRRGHITGSVSVPMTELVDWKTGVFASADEIKAHFEKAGVLAADRVITYCGGGGCATTDGFALALLGLTNVAMYDNSLWEWGNDPALPMTDPGSQA